MDETETKPADLEGMAAELRQLRATVAELREMVLSQGDKIADLSREVFDLEVSQGPVSRIMQHVTKVKLEG